MSKHELTARVAYEIYLQRGRAPGRSREDWAAAEAVVELCLAFAATLLEERDERESAQVGSAEGQLTPIPSPPSAQERAFALLTAAAEELGRKELAKTLGYKSTSSVGPYLRGQRPIGVKLSERILAALAPTSKSEASRRAA
jgi:DUF2934 family protein